MAIPCTRRRTCSYPPPSPASLSGYLARGTPKNTPPPQPHTHKRCARRKMQTPRISWNVSKSDEIVDCERRFNHETWARKRTPAGILDVCVSTNRVATGKNHNERKWKEVIVNCDSDVVRSSKYTTRSEVYLRHEGGRRTS